MIFLLASLLGSYSSARNAACNGNATRAVSQRQNENDVHVMEEHRHRKSE